MLKVLAKKSLATLIILVMAISMLPVSAGAEVLTYSDLELADSEAVFVMDSEHATISETTTEDGVVYGTELSTVASASASNASTVGFYQIDTGSYAGVTNIRGFNREASGRTVDATARSSFWTYEDDTQANKVLEIRGEFSGEEGATETAEDVVIGYDSNGNKLQTVANTTKQVWSVDVKMSNPDAGAVRLFMFTSNSSNFNTIFNGNPDTATTTVGIEGGSVVTTVDDYALKTGATLDQTIAEGLEAGKWYRIVRVMERKDEASDTSYPYRWYENVYVFDVESGACLGSKTAWSVAARGVKAYPLTHAIATKGIPQGETVQIDNYRIWEPEAPTYDITSQTLEGSTAGKVGALFTEETDVKYASAYANLFYRPAEETGHVDTKLNVDVYLPSVGGENEVAHVFAPQKAKGADADQRIFEVHYSAGATEEEAGYTTASICSNDGTAITKTPMTDTDGNPVKLDEKTWYTFSCDYNTYTGVYSASITDRGTGTVLAAQEGTRQAFEPYTANWSGASSCGVVGAAGYTGAVLFDNISIKSYKPDGTQSNSGKSYGSKTENFESAALGTTVRSLISSNWGVTGDMATDANCYVVSLDNYLLTGKVMSTTPAPIIITTSFKASGAEDCITLTNETTGETMPIGVTTSEDGKTITVDLGVFEYETSYTLKVTGLKNALGFAADDKELLLDVIKDQFVASAVKFVDGADGATELTEALVTDDTVKASVTLANGDAKDRDYLVILTLYKDNILVDVTSKSGTVTAGATETVVTDEALTATEDGQTAKIYVWDNWTNMKPKTDGADVLPGA